VIDFAIVHRDLREGADPVSRVPIWHAHGPFSDTLIAILSMANEDIGLL
jgi:hypothetical protein